LLGEKERLVIGRWLLTSNQFPVPPAGVTPDRIASRPAKMGYSLLTSQGPDISNVPLPVLPCCGFVRTGAQAQLEKRGWPRDLSEEFFIFLRWCALVLRGAQVFRGVFIEVWNR
jgi:hypothetical protein